MKRDYAETVDNMRQDYEAKLAKVGEERQLQLSQKESEIFQMKDDSGECTISATRKFMWILIDILIQLNSPIDKHTLIGSPQCYSLNCHAIFNQTLIVSCNDMCTVGF